MPRRTGAVHVATVRSTSRDRVYETTLLRRTYREDGKVKHETLRKIGLEGLLASRPSRERDLAVAMVVSRILNPSSKLATCRSLEEETKTSTLGEVLGLGSLDEDDLYGAMDWLVA